MRRFKLITKNGKEFSDWIIKKGLSRNDLIYILTSVELNREAFPQNTLDAIQQAYPPDELYTVRG
jgi:hypothetical protein